jgi:predicted glycoside hydrolase/deacetylase ChbG (UPF0249 family)
LLDAGVGVGLHLSLTWGRALSGPIEGLTDANGSFLPLARVLAACLTRRPAREQVRSEVAAQLERARDLIPALSHLNGHHHVHVFPVVRDAVLEAARGFEALHLRVPRRWAPSLRLLLLAALSTRFVSRARAALGAFEPLPLVGLELTGARHHGQRFMELAARLRVSRAEWLVHPRVGAAQDAPLGARAADADELATLTRPDVLERLADLGIVPTRYRDLSD